MIVHEIFYSLQGEGKLAGVPSVFIRLAGCPLRCRWCDTKYAWDPKAGEETMASRILDKINHHPTRYIVVTGGEPMQHDGVVELSRLLRSRNYHITVETAGIEYLPRIAVDLMSISPKLGNSVPAQADAAAVHEKQRLKPEIVRQLIRTFDYQLKFVVESAEDLDEIAAFIDALGPVDPYKIFLMPQAIEPKDYLDKSRWLADYCLQTGFRFSPRLHVILWSGQRGR